MILLCQVTKLSRQVNDEMKLDFITSQTISCDLLFQVAVQKVGLFDFKTVRAAKMSMTSNRPTVMRRMWKTSHFQVRERKFVFFKVLHHAFIFCM
jgi:hypothetical protein